MIRMCGNFRRSALAAMAAVAVFVAPVFVGAVQAQYRMDQLPEGAGVVPDPQIVEKPNAQIPMDLEFKDQDGKTVKLGSLFHSGKPVVLSLVYFSCPLLCGANQEGLVEAVKEGPRGLSLGKDYDIVVVSIDSDDTPAAAKVKRDHYVDLMNRNPASEPGVTYLTGSEENIKQLADTVGFGYVRLYNNDNKFKHATGIFICTPEGRLSQTIQGISFEPDTLHYRLVQASNGQIGSGLLSFALCCGAMRFNAKTGLYENNPYFYVGTVTGIVTIVMVGGFLAMLFRSDGKRKHLVPPPPAPTS